MGAAGEGRAPVLALVGPTASGKSDAALGAAERIGAELVCADAFTVYRGMDVGTAKPGSDARARVAHHCLDLLEVSEESSAAWFQQVARAAIDRVVASGRPALVVGGSGLYVRAAVDRIEFPPADERVRAWLERRWADQPAERLHEAVAAADPASAERIGPSNRRRSLRALEAMALTGQRPSTRRAGWYEHRAVDPGLVVVGLDPGEALDERIRRRTDRMLDDGLVEETAVLARAHPGADGEPAGGWSRTARRAIGYRQALEVLAGRLPADRLGPEVALRTRQLAVRQRRWFRRDPRVAWTHDPDEAIGALVRACAS